MKQSHFINFFTNFFGYGNWETEDWFIGIEEGGGNNLNHVNQKINQFYYWSNIKFGLVDNFEFQSLLDEVRISRFLDCTNQNGPNSQSTWIHPMKALLFNRYRTRPNILDVKWSQILSLGRQNNVNNINSCWIELLPLPNPGTSNDAWSQRWPIWTSEFTKEWRLPLNRQVYEDRQYPGFNMSLIDFRSLEIQNKIEFYKPKNVICYVGTNPRYVKVIDNISNNLCKNNWVNHIVPNSPNFIIQYKDIYWSNNNKTRIMLTRHPSRTPHEIYWLEVGSLLNSF
jgi:hypothetical protein